MTPHYVSTSHGQLRVFVAGAGRPVVVLPGLVQGAGMRAARLAREAEDIAFHVIELPGIGGSAGVAVDEAEAAVAEARTMLGLAHAPVLAYDLSANLHRGTCIGLDSDLATAWATLGITPPDLAPRPDGTHLTALFAFLRDRHILDAANPSHAARAGAPLPDAEELDRTAVAAAVDPVAYAALWRRCLAAPPPGRRSLAEALAAVRSSPETAPISLPSTAPRPPLWCDHADLPRGRQHLRRAGTNGPLLIALQSAPGSAAPLVPLLHGLAPARRVVAPDYIGNGDSDRPDQPVDIARLARDTLDLADALGEDRFDLWGTHTGALIALETALLAPERVGRLILEAPPLLSPEFTADILANYLPKLRPHPWGLHFQQAWCMRRDMFLFWPWYRAERAAARPLAVPDAGFLHDWTVGLLKSGSTYDRTYRAAFEYDPRAALGRLARPALLCAGPSDMLADGLAVAAQYAPEYLTVAATPATVWYPNQNQADIALTMSIYLAFLMPEPVAADGRQR